MPRLLLLALAVVLHAGAHEMRDMALVGTHDWALLHFRRGAGRAAPARAFGCPVQAIGCSAPVEGR